MTPIKRRDARKCPVLSIPPGNGTGIQITKGRIQPYTVWNELEIEQFCYDENEAYFVLQEVLDGYRIGADYEEVEEEEDDF